MEYILWSNDCAFHPMQEGNEKKEEKKGEEIYGRWWGRDEEMDIIILLSVAV